MITYHQYDKGQTAPMEHLPETAGETYAVGEALGVGEGGGVTKCAATEKPLYLCLGPAHNGLVPVSRIAPDIVYDAPLSADGAALKLGNKVTLGADALTVTATTASGVAELVRIDGTAAGDTVGVRFV